MLWGFGTAQKDGGLKDHRENIWRAKLSSEKFGTLTLDWRHGDLDSAGRSMNAKVKEMGRVELTDIEQSPAITTVTAVLTMQSTQPRKIPALSATCMRFLEVLIISVTHAFLGTLGSGCRG